MNRKCKILYFVVCLIFGCICFSCKKVVFEAIPFSDIVLSKENEYVVILGDIQNYTSCAENLPYLEATMNWIQAQIQQNVPIQCVLHTGDVTNTNTINEWQNFYNVTVDVASLVPYVTCTGNHDYDWNSEQGIEDRNSTHITEYASFPITTDLIVSQFEVGRMENIIVKNYIHGQRYDILVLEFSPRDEVVAWADQYLKSHSDQKFILLTHEFLSKYGERVNEKSFGKMQILNTSYSSPERIWNELIKANDNIMCVLCGHNGFSRQLYSENLSGRLVPQMLFNLQYLENGGGGWVQLWEIPQGTDSISVKTFNTVTGAYHTNPLTFFKFRYKY